MTLTCSVSQFADLMGIEPHVGQGVKYFDYNPSTGMIVIVMEEKQMQGTGTNPPLSDNLNRKPAKKKGKR